MEFVLIDDPTVWRNFLPLTFTKPVSYLRCGILTIKQKWEKFLDVSVMVHSEKYLSKKFNNFSKSEAIFISSNVMPNKQLVELIKNLKTNQALTFNNKLIAFNGVSKQNENQNLNCTELTIEPLTLNNVWDIFQKNSEALKNDFEILTQNKKSENISSSNTIIGDKNLIFLEKGAKVEACILNTNSGPIYLGEESEIMEGSVVRGGLALCEHSVLKLSTKIYGATTIGPYSKVGGEVNNSVIFGYSNKAHDGFLGNSVIGEWCNLGADTNNSNLKNNYGNVKLYNYLQKTMIDTGLQFCGLIMGDYSKSGINTMFNTGTVVGVGANVFGSGFPSTHINNFSWGGVEGFSEYQIEKLIETTKIVYNRRGLVFDNVDEQILFDIKNNN